MTDALAALCALARLTPRQREAWVNRTVLGWTHDQSAMSMGITKSAVGQLVAKAERRLAEIIELEGEEAA